MGVSQRVEPRGLTLAFGAAVHGVGFAALRLRTTTIWPIIIIHAIHALHDLFLQLGMLPIPLIKVPIDTAMLLYGIILLRRAPDGSRREDRKLARAADLAVLTGAAPVERGRRSEA